MVASPSITQTSSELRGSSCPLLSSKVGSPLVTGFEACFERRFNPGLYNLELMFLCPFARQVGPSDLLILEKHQIRSRNFGQCMNLAFFLSQTLHGTAICADQARGG